MASAPAGVARWLFLAINSSTTLARVKPLVGSNRFRLEHVSNHDLIGHAQALYQLLLKDVPAQGVGARLQNRPQPIGRSNALVPP